MLNSQQTATVKLCLLTLAEWADADGGNCYPSIPSIASRASVNEKTVRRSLDQAETAGFIRRSHKGSAQGWRRYMYHPTQPEGADTTPARSDDGAGTESTPSPQTCGLSVQNVRTLSPERAGTESTDLSITYPIPSNKSDEADASRPADLWSDGIRLLTDSGTSREDAGKTIGKLRKELGEDDAAEVIRNLMALRPTGPRSYLFGVMNKRKQSPRVSQLPRDTRSDDEQAAATMEEARRFGLEMPA